MKRALLYIIGGPGSGKSTLMAQLTHQWQRAALTRPQRDLLVNPVTGLVDAVELGTRRGVFSGTDALPQNAIDTVEPWLVDQLEAPLVLGEGARLGCKRFLQTAVGAGYTVRLVHLVHSHTGEWLTMRSTALGRTQNASWVQGRATAARNLAMDHPPGVLVSQGHPDLLAAGLRRWMDGCLVD